MDHPPGDPEPFFTEYLPARFGAWKDRPHGITSVGSLLFRVVGRGEWSLRLRDGDLEVTRAMEDDVMLQVTVSADDFTALVSEAAGAGVHAGTPKGVPLRALGVDPETARLVRHVPGSVLFVAREGALSRRLLVTPGRRKADLAVAECTIECSFDDLRDAREKGLSFMQLFVGGKLRISGNVQIAMALSGVFA